MAWKRTCMSYKIAWSFADKSVGIVQNISGAPWSESICVVCQCFLQRSVSVFFVAKPPDGRHVLFDAARLLRLRLRFDCMQRSRGCQLQLSAAGMEHLGSCSG